MKKGYNKVIVVIITILVFLSISLIIFIKRNEKDEEFKNLKINGYNSFINSTVNENEMVSIYLNDYIKLLQFNIKKAYSILDNNFRETKFPNINSFESYIKDLDYSSKIDNYQVKIEDNNYVFYVTSNNVKFIFKTTGVMQYTVIIEKS